MVILGFIMRLTAHQPAPRWRLIKSFDDDAAAAAAATAITLTNASPNSGPVGVASNNFTVGANGAISGTVVVTPSDGGAGGAFTPTKRFDSVPLANWNVYLYANNADRRQNHFCKQMTAVCPIRSSVTYTATDGSLSYSCR